MSVRISLSWPASSILHYRRLHRASRAAEGRTDEMAHEKMASSFVEFLRDTPIEEQRFMTKLLEGSGRSTTGEGGPADG